MAHFEFYDLPPEAKTKAITLRARLDADRFHLALLKFAQMLKGFSPNQPRVPAGNPHGGQWTREGGANRGNGTGNGTSASGESLGGQETAMNYLLTGLFANVRPGGTFDYQRGAGNLITGFDQLRQFRNVSNFNVGLFCQQAGLTLNETLSIAGFYASRFSSNANPNLPYGLSSDQYRLTVLGHNAGRTGVYGPAAPARTP